MPTPTETRSVTYVDWADYPANEAALLIGAVWGESPGSPITISYSFGETDSVWSSNPGDYPVGNSEPYQGYQPLNEEERDAFRRAFDAWSDVANITFVEIDETATSVGDIRVAISSEVSLENFDAWGYYPAVTGAAGDIWVAPEIGTALEIVPGDYFQFVAVHEIGHALGLAHPFADPFYTEKPALSLAFDNQLHTVMSYTEGNSAIRPSTPMAFDIAAIQALYGANMATGAGDTDYKFETQSTANVYCIWDSGGHDAFDFSALEEDVLTDALSGALVDLAEGAKSYYGHGLTAQTFTIAFGAVIEDVVGSAYIDRIWGNDADNVIDGGMNKGTASDYIYAGNGDDTIIARNGSVGGEIDGGDGNDTIKILSAGTDMRLVMGEGDDTVYFGEGVHFELRDFTGGYDTLHAFDSYVDEYSGISYGGVIDKSGVFERVILEGTADANVTMAGFVDLTVLGNSGQNILKAHTGNDYIDGGLGNDQLYGGLGNDTYVVDSAADKIVEAGGIDTVVSAVAWTLAGDLENLTLTGVAPNKGTGNALGNVILGNTAANILAGLAGNDWLDGGKGADMMQGGAGNDVYWVDVAGDVVSESGGSGYDLVHSAVSFTLGGGFEELRLEGAGNLNGTGNTAANTILGNGGDNVLVGGSGNDTLVGFGGNDVLDGRIGSDKLRGGSGNDTYVINAAGDAIDEEGNADTNDLVRSAISVSLTTLAAGLIEHATLTGAAAISAMGNAAANILTGNGGANTLDGKGGADVMSGGKGADTYVVDDAGDQVTESLAGAAGGIDLVKSAVSYTLGANLEKLTLTGTGDIDAFGNSLNNTLVGNEGDNHLDGGAGNDRMSGGKGDDIYIVNAAGDSVIESIGAGTDTVFSSITFSLASRVNVENLHLTGVANINGTGNSRDNELIGNDGANKLDGGFGNDLIDGGTGNDTLIGGAGNDLLTGGIGIDKLTGGTGRDLFDFNDLAEASDTITDFKLGAGGDVLDLRDLLDGIGYFGSDPFADAIVNFSASGANTLVSIDADGVGGSLATGLATLLSVTLTSVNMDNYLV